MAEIHLSVHKHENAKDVPIIPPFSEIKAIVEAIEKLGYEAFYNDNGTIIFSLKSKEVIK